MTDDMQRIFLSMDQNGFSAETISLLDAYITDIENGSQSFERFAQSEQAGLRAGGRTLIWAAIVASYARWRITAGGDATIGSTGGRTVANWEIDAYQEQLIEQYARAVDEWVDVPESEWPSVLGQKIAQGAESKVYYTPGETTVVKARTSIYATLQRALDAIVLHNFLFPNTAMHVMAFTRDADGLFRMVLTQPYIDCLRLATKAEIDELISPWGFCEIEDGNGVNYENEHMRLEDLHPANVFINRYDHRICCIDCIARLKL